MQSILANSAVSVSELKKNPSAVLAGAHGEAVALLNHNHVMGYILPSALYEALLERLDDLDLASIAQARSNEIAIPVKLHDL